VTLCDADAAAGGGQGFGVDLNPFRRRVMCYVRDGLDVVCSTTTVRARGWILILCASYRGYKGRIRVAVHGVARTWVTRG